MRVLVACEESQEVCKAFRALGHVAYSCDLPPLVPTNIVAGREQRVWRMSPGPDRAKLRSKTYPGIAKAMAEQWGGVINGEAEV